jgi:hypothetical protein
MFQDGSDVWRTLPTVRVQADWRLNGLRRYYPTAVQTYLNSEGAIVAALLRPDRAFSLEEILDALDTPPDSPTASAIALVVLRLVSMNVAVLTFAASPSDG